MLTIWKVLVLWCRTHGNRKSRTILLAGSTLSFVVKVNGHPLLVVVPLRSFSKNYPLTSLSIVYLNVHSSIKWYLLLRNHFISIVTPHQVSFLQWRSLLIRSLAEAKEVENNNNYFQQPRIISKIKLNAFWDTQSRKWRKSPKWTILRCVAPCIHFQVPSISVSGYLPYYQAIRICPFATLSETITEITYCCIFDVQFPPFASFSKQWSNPSVILASVLLTRMNCLTIRTSG